MASRQLFCFSFLLLLVEGILLFLLPPSLFALHLCFLVSPCFDLWNLMPVSHCSSLATVPP